MKFRVLVTVVVLAGLSFALWTYLAGSREPDTASLLTAKVRRGPLVDTVSATGILEPSRLVQIGAQVSGQLKTVHVQLNDTVRTGDLIAEIDSLQQQDELRLAQASLAEIQAANRSRTFQLEKAEETLRRQRALYAGRAGSGAELKDAQSAVHIARAELDLSIAQIERATIEVEKAQTKLQYTRITSPMDGRVIGLISKPGQTLNAAQTTPVIALIAQTDPMLVKVQIPESDVSRVKPGQTLEFTTFSQRTIKRASTLTEVQPAPASMLTNADTGASSQSGASAQAVYYSALFHADNADGKLLPMMTADVTITTSKLENAVVAPLTALDGPDEEGVFTAKVKKPDGALEDRKVRVGLTTSDEAEILGGLTEGDEVVLSSDSGKTTTEMLLE